MPIVIGGLGDKKSNGGSQYFQQDRVYTSNGIAMCHPANIPGGSYRYLIQENIISCAMRGRYNKDGKVEQQLELNSTEHSNALTTAQKDSLIFEINSTKL